MGKILRNIIVSAAVGAAAVSCNTSGCVDNQSSIPLAGFYSYESLSSITVSSLTIGGVGAPNDSLLLDNSSASQIYLPFRPGEDVTGFFIHYGSEGLDDPALNDTITFTYDRIPYFASEECGAMYRYAVKDVAYTHHLIDSIGLVDSLITNVDTETIHIYFRTQTNE
jgi:hypothetical protein